VLSAKKHLPNCLVFILALVQDESKGGRVRLKLLSLNCENLSDLAPRDPNVAPSQRAQRRSWLLAALLDEIDADIVGLVEAASTQDRTQHWMDTYLPGKYSVHQAELRGILGLAFAIRSALDLNVEVRSKQDCNEFFKLQPFDADNDGIRELYTWANRVPHEVVLSGGGLAAPTTMILIHAKSKGVFIPGDLYAYEKLSRASRMKLRAQGVAVRSRLDELIDDDGKGRVIVLGDLNDSAEFDIYSAQLGGSFLMSVMGNVWDPLRVFTNPHHGIDRRQRWTIDFKDRVVNPLQEVRYGMPASMRSWIDHILVSPGLRTSLVPDSATIHHTQPVPAGWDRVPRGARGTDHHPPSVSLEL
jgi:endonuclease/exonuclease/phosphatase family metal-dependent hydrolase